ncbi:MAG: maleylpyruvate isomerase family mycothiol-dependent enzyme [Actinomycetota bacterium]
MADHSIDMAAVGAMVSARTDQLCDRLGTLEVDQLERPSLLPGWSVLTVACHLRYGAQALRQITAATLAEAPSAYYPGGRDVQRPFTLEPALGEPRGHVVESLRHEAGELRALWTALDDDAWGRSMIPHPGDDDTLGPIPLRDLALLRLVEVMVHGSDLGLGLAPWPLTFGQWLLPLRVERARVAHADGFDAVVEFEATDAPTRRARFVDGTPTPSDGDPDLVVSAVANDLVALLLGRQPLGGVSITGDADLVVRFRDGVTGP